MPLIYENLLTTIRRARYFTLTGTDNHKKELWILLHGYGQSAKDFLRDFSHINAEEKLFVAPEGLSKFYIKLSDRKIGASWMTRDNRENEIKDINDYLNKVIDELRSRYDTYDKINFLGFSQGVAVLLRYIYFNKITPNKIILWEGEFPKDLTVHNLPDLLNGSKVELIYGKKDKIISETIIKEQLNLFDISGIIYNLHYVDISHNLDNELLTKLIADK